MLARGAARIIGAGASVVRSSTRGLQDLYTEAREEYEADRASMRTVGPPLSPEQPNLAVPGSVSEQIQTPQIITSPAGARKTTAGARKRTTSKAAAPTMILGPDGKPVKRGRGRPRKDSILVPPAGHSGSKKSAVRSTDEGARGAEASTGRSSITVEQGSGPGAASRHGAKPRGAGADSAEKRENRSGSDRPKSDSPTGTRSIAGSPGRSSARSSAGKKGGSKKSGPTTRGGSHRTNSTDSGSTNGKPAPGAAGGTDVPPPSGSETNGA